MTEKEMMDMMLDAVMSGDPLKVQATLRSVKDAYSQQAKLVEELKQQKTILEGQVESVMKDLEVVKNEKETIASLYHEKWESEPIDSKEKDQPEIIEEEVVVAELFNK